MPRRRHELPVQMEFGDGRTHHCHDQQRQEVVQGRRPIQARHGGGTLTRPLATCGGGDRGGHSGIFARRRLAGRPSFAVRSGLVGRERVRSREPASQG